MENEIVVRAYNQLDANVKALKTELPGISFGYIGNCGVDRRGPYDDRSWRVFLPHPGRIGTISDCVYLGKTGDLPKAVERWAQIEQEIRVNYPQAERDQQTRKISRTIEFIG